MKLNENGVLRTRTLVACLVTGALVMSVGAVSPAAAGLRPNDCVPELRLQSGWCGDGGRATRALLYGPSAVSAWEDGSFVVLDRGTTASDGQFAVVRRVRADGVIVAAAGVGEAGSSGDGGPAVDAQISPGDVAAMPDGSFLISETATSRIRRVAPDGTISTVAGTGEHGFFGDGGPASAAVLDHPRGIAATPDGGFVVADTGNRRVRRVAADGTITTIAGDGRRGSGGDWGPATQASLTRPTDVTALADGGFVLVDAPDHGEPLIRVVLPDGTIFTQYDLLDFAYLSCVCIARDPAIAVTASGPMLITTANWVMRLGRDQSEEIVAGTGDRCGYEGDGGPARRAVFAGISDIAVLDDGGYLVADSQNSRVRRVDAAGVVDTAAGGGGQNGARAGRRRGAAATVSSAGPPCRASAAPAKYPPFNGFELLPTSPSRGVARVAVATTLPARVTLTLWRGRKRVGQLRRLDVRGQRKLAIGRSLRSGRYRVSAMGRADGFAPRKRELTVSVKGR